MLRIELMIWKWYFNFNVIICLLWDNSTLHQTQREFAIFIRSVGMIFFSKAFFPHFDALNHTVTVTYVHPVTDVVIECVCFFVFPVSKSPYQVGIPYVRIMCAFEIRPNACPPAKHAPNTHHAFSIVIHNECLTFLHESVVANWHVFDCIESGGC